MSTSLVKLMVELRRQKLNRKKSELLSELQGIDAELIKIAAKQRWWAEQQRKRTGHEPEIAGPKYSEVAGAGSPPIDGGKVE